MYPVSTHTACIHPQCDASGQPDPAPLNLTMETFQAARSGLPGLKFLPPYGQQLALATYNYLHFDSYVEQALQVCGCPDLKEGIEATFRVLAGQSRPVGFEALIEDLKTQTQATQSLPDAIKAIIDVDALIAFAQQNPGQALSSPEVLRMLIFGLALRYEGGEQRVAFCDAVDRQFKNLVRGYGGAEIRPFTVVFNYEPLAELTAADVDEVFTELTMSPRTLLWNEIEEMSVDVPEADVDGVLKSLDVQPERSLSGRFPLLAELLSNVPGTSAEVVNEDKPESGQLTDIG